MKTLILSEKMSGEKNFKFSFVYLFFFVIFFTLNEKKSFLISFYLKGLMKS